MFFIENILFVKYFIQINFIIKNVIIFFLIKFNIISIKIIFRILSLDLVKSKFQRQNYKSRANSVIPNVTDNSSIIT